jgi:predicted DCC family thiol-disulfide oxidoreductase YuxK
MTSLAGAWQRFWFPAVPVRRLAIYRIVIATFAFFDVTVVSGFISRYSSVSHEFYKPLYVLRLGGHDLHVSPGATSVLHVVLAVALAMAIFGLYTRVALLISAPLYLWWFGTYYSFGAVQHGRIMVLISLMVMLVAPAGRAFSIDAIRLRARRAGAGVPIPPPLNETDQLAGWALRVIMILVVAAYTLAAYAKIHTSGLGWATSGALQRLIVEKHTPAGNWLAHYPTIVKSMQVLTLFMEATTAVVLLRGRIRDFYFLALAGFHTGTLVLTNINFLGLMVGYLAFYDLEVGVARVGAFVRKRVRVKPVEMVYDADCGLCARAITSLLALDWLHAITVRPGPPGLSAMRATRGGRTSEGYAAVREAAHVVPALWPTLVVAYLPPVEALGRRVYAWVADHRSTSGSCGVGPDAACAVPDAAGQTTSEKAPSAQDRP